MMKLKTAILNKPYTVVEEGRGNTDTFDKPRFWVTGGTLTTGVKKLGAVRSLWNTHRKTGKPFYLFWSEPNTSKFHASIVAGEAIPYIGNRLVLIHTNNLKDQHTDHLEHWKTIPGYIKNNWRVETIQGVAALVKKATAGMKLDKDEIERFEYIKKTCFLVLDELHRYSKNHQKELKQLTAVLDFMLTKELKIALGTTATAKHLTAVWEWADCYVERSQYTYRTSKEELIIENWKEPFTSYLWADNKTDLVDMAELESASIDINNEDAVEDFLWEVSSNSCEDVLVDLRSEGLEVSKSLAKHLSKYIPNRIDAAVQHYLKNNAGTPCLLAVNGQANAINSEKKYQADFGLQGVECIAWNSEGKNTHPVYKNNERKMLEDLFDPTHPLKFVFVNGMLREGTNKPFKVAYQCNFTTKNADGSKQFTARAQEAVIIIDAPILKYLPKIPGMLTEDHVADVLEKAGIEATPSELQEAINKFNAAISAESARQHSDIEDGKIPGLGIDMDVVDQNLIDFFNMPTNANYSTVLSKDVWVYGVSHEGNLTTLPLPTSNIHRSLNQKASSLIEVFGNV
jgi:hypothetical protein